MGYGVKMLYISEKEETFRVYFHYFSTEHSDVQKKFASWAKPCCHTSAFYPWSCYKLQKNAPEVNNDYWARSEVLYIHTKGPFKC